MYASLELCPTEAVLKVASWQIDLCISVRKPFFTFHLNVFSVPLPEPVLKVL